MPRPVLLVPGFLGTRLRNRNSREVTWGSLRALYGSVSRLEREQFHLSGDLDENPNTPDDVVTDFTVIPGLIRHDFYNRFRRTLEARGYEVGRTLFLWAYDWRRSVAVLAAQLGALLDHIGEPVHAIAHSTGGLVLEYYLRYGTPPLARAKEPTFEAANRFLSCTWVGATMRGTCTSVRDMFNGLRPAPGGLRFPTAAIVTFPGAYEAFPYDGRILRTEKGQLLDLYDAALWNEHGWPVKRRSDLKLMRALHGDGFDLNRHVAEHLANSRALHEALLRGPAWPPGRHWVVANDRIPTAAFIPVYEADGWKVPEFPRYSDRMADHFVDGDMTTTMNSALRGTHRNALPSNVTISYYRCRHRYLVGHPPVIADFLSRI